jgi:hypothetical protein
MKKIKRPLKKNDDVKYTLIQETKSDRLDKLLELYASDKERARIFYFLNRNEFWLSRKVLFESADGSFRFVIYNRKFGISETSKIYSRETMIESISYNGKRLYSCHRINGSIHKVRDLTFNNIKSLNDANQITWNNPLIDTTVIDYMKKRFGWLRYIEENSFLHFIGLNKVIINKLYNLKDLFRYQYKCPYPIANMVYTNMSNYSDADRLVKWTEIRKRLISVENLSEEMFTNPLFFDTCKLSQMVNKKVNCSWGMNRLKLEHDKWTKIVTNVMIESEPFKKLKIARVYEDFAKFSGFELLRTNHDLIIEGKKKNHCVATYVNSVERGNCGIYRVYGCTLELRINDMFGNKVLLISQYMDYNNTPAPKKYRDMIQEKLDIFNKTIDTDSSDFFSDDITIENLF